MGLWTNRVFYGLDVMGEPGVATAQSDPFRTFVRVAVWSTGVAAAIGLLSAFLFAAAADFDLAHILEPADMLGVGSSGANIYRWAALADMIGYYLCLIPLFITTGWTIRRSGPSIVDIATFAALSYAVIGGTTAVVLAFGVPPLLEAYLDAPEASRAALRLAFIVLTDVAYRGIWQTLDTLLIGTWALITGLVLLGRRIGVAAAGIGFGVISLLAAFVRGADIEAGTDLELALAGVWGIAFWLYIGWLAMLLASDSLGTSTD